MDFAGTQVQKVDALRTKSIWHTIENPFFDMSMVVEDITQQKLDLSERSRKNDKYPGQTQPLMCINIMSS